MRHPSAIAVVLLLGCGSLQSQPPEGLTCSNVISVGADLTQALRAAMPGDCLVLPEGTWTGTFMVPDDVSLVGSEGARVVIKGDSSSPVLSVRGGVRSTVRKLRIEAPLGSGILIDPGPVNLVAVSVVGAKGSALESRCTQPDCAQRTVSLEAVELLDSRLGLLARGAVVRMRGGRVAGHGGQGLSDGSGIIASAGSALSLTDVTIEQNANIGLLLDGPTTRAALSGVTVQNNLGRGLWSQGLRGAQTLTVRASAFLGNARVGLGARDSEGVSVEGARIEDTRKVTVPVDLQRSEDVGDGLGLFAKAAGASLSGLQLRNNFRAQALVDDGGDGIALDGTFEGGQYRAVVQNTSSAVSVPAQGLQDAGKVLFVDPSALSIP